MPKPNSIDMSVLDYLEECPHFTMEPSIISKRDRITMCFLVMLREVSLGHSPSSVPLNFCLSSSEVESVEWALQRVLELRGRTKLKPDDVSKQALILPRSSTSIDSVLYDASDIVHVSWSEDEGETLIVVAFDPLSHKEGINTWFKRLACQALSLITRKTKKVSLIDLCWSHKDAFECTYTSEGLLKEIQDLTDSIKDRSVHLGGCGAICEICTRENCPCHSAKQKQITPGVKHDTGKPRLSLVPPECLDQLIKVLEGGAVKYAPDGWKTVPDAETRYYDAAFRHLQAHRKGEIIDPESSLPHISHVFANIMFLVWFNQKNTNS